MKKIYSFFIYILLNSMIENL